MADTDQKAWFITGASSGLGRTLTERLLAQGQRVAATARKPEALNDLKAQHGNRLWVQALDVTDTAAIRQVISTAFEEMGRVDVIVSNAGYGLFGAAEELADDQIVQQINTNLVGSIQVIRAALPHLRAQGGGRILQVSSEGGQIAYPNFSLYHATKWGIEGFVEAVAQEVAPFGIELTLVEPGPTRTNFGSGLVSPPALAVYESTPSGEMRRSLTAETSSWKYADPVKTVQAMVNSVAVSPAPRRLTLGGGSYERLTQAFTDRRAALEAQKDIAYSVDE